MADRYQKRRQTRGAMMRLSPGSPSATTPTLLSWFSAACAREWVCIVVIFLIVVFVVNTFNLNGFVLFAPLGGKMMHT